MIEFSDGVKFDSRGKCRLVCKYDGLYVVGDGMLCAVDSREEGYALIESFKKKEEL